MGFKLVKDRVIVRVRPVRSFLGRFLGCFDIRDRYAYCGDLTAVRDQGCAIPGTMSTDISFGIHGGNRFVHRLKARRGGYIPGVAIRVRCDHRQGNLDTCCLWTEL